MQVQAALSIEFGVVFGFPGPARFPEGLALPAADFFEVLLGGVVSPLSG